MRIVRNYKYIIIIIIIKKESIANIKCASRQRIATTAQSTNNEWFVEKTITRIVNGTARKRIRNKWFFFSSNILYHKACGKRIGPISNCHSNCTWFACFDRIITSVEWTIVSAAIIYLIWISHLCAQMHIKHNFKCIISNEIVFDQMKCKTSMLFRIE